MSSRSKRGLVRGHIGGRDRSRPRPRPGGTELMPSIPWKSRNTQRRSHVTSMEVKVSLHGSQSIASTKVIHICQVVWEIAPDKLTDHSLRCGPSKILCALYYHRGKYEGGRADGGMKCACVFKSSVAGTCHDAVEETAEGGVLSFCCIAIGFVWHSR